MLTTPAPRPPFGVLKQTLSQTLAAGLRGPRLRPWRWLLLFSLILATLTRVALIQHTGKLLDPTLAKVALMLLAGLGWDLIAASFLLLPLLLTLTLFPLRWRRTPVGHFILLAGMVGWVFALVFIAISEWIFWEEFGTRFNFIAVDYLVYTHEVVANIWESYPVAVILSLLSAFSIALVWWQRRAIDDRAPRPHRWVTELLATSTLVVMSVATWQLFDRPSQPLFANRYANEIVGNGIFEFVRAFEMAELDYDTFYPKIPRREAYARVRHLLPAAAEGHFIDDLAFTLTREITAGATPRALNVVLISVESLSADYFSRFGNQQGITPNLDRLAKEGLFYTNLYATGTRTVRGLEALTLSIPPTPGESIVKRPKNTGLVSLGSILRAQGYDVRFLYGGYGRFDNMEEFFAGNGYEVVDRTAIPPEKIHHENAWGVADEDVYTQALLEIGRSKAANRLSFTHIMTTSNHRPYTYPEGRIDLPSGHAGRDGGVKYTDWAIGDFIARAQGEAWFKNTIFVIVADHCASSAGKTQLPLRRYHIPMIIYAPGLVAPSESSVLASQIDVAPTVLGLLNISYRAPFFGRDLRGPLTRAPYALVSTYQELGFLRDGQLVELAPNKAPKLIKINRKLPAATAAANAELTDDTIALYQVAADAFRVGALRQPE